MKVFRYKGKVYVADKKVPHIENMEARTVVVTDKNLEFSVIKWAKPYYNGQYEVFDRKIEDVVYFNTNKEVMDFIASY